MKFKTYYQFIPKQSQNKILKQDEYLTWLNEYYIHLENLYNIALETCYPHTINKKSFFEIIFNNSTK